MYNKRFCKEPEKIENYEKAAADNFVGWRCHHRLETHNSDGERRLVDITPAELQALGMYYNRPASELIFLTISEHHSLHNSGSGNPMRNEESRKKDSEAHKGEKNPMYGKHHTEEARKKISEGNKGKKYSEEAKKKISDAKKGKPGKPHSEEAKKKIGIASKLRNKNRCWFNNGKINKFCFECPEGFVPGQLRK